MAPPVKTKDPVLAQGLRLVGLDELGPGGVREVETAEHGTLAVGVRPTGEPFAMSNVCRHQFAKLGQGHVDGDGCLVCPWHRARYDVDDGSMVDGPKGRIFGFPPYSKTVHGVANKAAPLRTFPVTVRDRVIWLLA